MFHEIFGQRHFLPDVPYTRGMRILDCGYGQGSWAFDMASMYAEGEVSRLPFRCSDTKALMMIVAAPSWGAEKLDLKVVIRSTDDVVDPGDGGRRFSHHFT